MLAVRLVIGHICISKEQVINHKNHLIMNSIEQIIQRAKQGDSSAQLVLATRYEQGISVPQSNYEAYRWMAMAANGGNHLAQSQLSEYKSKAMCDLRTLSINRQSNKMAC